mmetsp:Transcript_7195/g.9138  ORF Transcript_7195/g.9138 Transcript_7195/m.9138 type:complete len:430 (+) Transcript_7195:73-1362(+)
MSSSTNNLTWLKPFLTGVLTSAATFHLLPKLVDSLKNSREQTKYDTKPTTNSTSSSAISTSSTLMDSPTLDQRILRKAEAAIQGRTSRLIIVVERCTNDHNYSAILRTAEALGVQNVYIIDPQACNSTIKKDGDGDGDGDGDDEKQRLEDNEKNMKLYRSTGQHVRKYAPSEVKDRAQHHLFAQRAVEWLDVKEFETTKECVDELKRKGYQIWSTDLSQVAVCMTREELMKDNNVATSDDASSEVNVIPDKLAIVFGTEAVGCTTEMLNASDKRVYLPLRGFADSLNLSVATALVLHQLFTLDPSIAGSMSENERVELRRKWYTKLASQRLQTKAEKAHRRRLNATIGEYEKLELKANETSLQPQQMDKIAKLPILRQELTKIDTELHQKSYKVIEDLVMNPPQPLGDMRRADEHRTTYVGKNTKKDSQ